MSKMRKIFSQDRNRASISDRLTSSKSEAIRDFFNIGNVKRLFRVGAELASAVAPYVEKPTTMNAVKAAFLVGRVLVDDMEVWPDDYFDESWESPYPHEFNGLVLTALAKKPFKVLRTSDESTVIHVVHVGDVRFGYVKKLKTDFVERIYVEADRIPDAKRIIKEELWRLLRDDNMILRRVRNPNKNDKETIAVEKDEAFRPMPSRRAAEYSSYLKKCITAGVPRSVLLYGPPGTGKSTMARTIVDSLGLRSLRIRVEDIGNIETSTVFEAINIFEPDAIIFDDFDRSNSQEALLEILEFFQKRVKVVIATVNNKNRLDEAILRPGRFDELLQIKQMDEDVIKAILGEAHASSYEQVKSWPVAFVQEYVKRLSFMSQQDAEESTKELARRVSRLTKYDDDEPTVDDSSRETASDDKKHPRRR